MNTSLLKTLDQMITVSNRLDSTVRETDRYYDPETKEHVVTLEYRVRVLVAPESPHLKESGSLLSAILNLES
jgi:hypothetical protein